MQNQIIEITESELIVIKEIYNSKATVSSIKEAGEDQGGESSENDGQELS